MPQASYRRTATIQIPALFLFKPIAGERNPEAHENRPMNKIRVRGKAQNRTALGIVNAYIIMYPEATLSDLKQAFPDDLNPDKGVKENFSDILKIAEVQPENFDGYFSKEDELISLADGTKVAMVKMWTKPSFERIVNKAKGYDIEVAAFDPADKGFGKKGYYSLEYLNGYQPPVSTAPAKKSKWWMWLLAALVLAGIILAIVLPQACHRQAPAEPQVIVKTDTVTVTKVDTVYVQHIEEIEKNFNAAQFEVDKADLNDKAKFALHDLAKVMEKNPQLKVTIVGHTSAEGDPTHNQQLSEARAKAAYDFLISEGVVADRLSYVGKGSGEPIDPNNPEANRRTEFIVE